MANQEHLDVLKQGVVAWNQWRKKHIDIRLDLTNANLKDADLVSADLSGADLSGADLFSAILTNADLSGATLRGVFLGYANLIHVNLTSADLSGVILGSANLTNADLSGATLRRAALSEAILRGAILRRADLKEAYFSEANLSEANLSEANLSEADLSEANLSRANLSLATLINADLSGAFLFNADLSGANLSGANLSGATLVETNLAEATLTNCTIYGIAAWNVELKGAKQDNLVITPDDEPTITVDNLKIAQFIYLLLNNAEIREVIDTITTKVVLILGRFTPERKTVLDALREELRKRNYLPIVFDFDVPKNRDITETVSLLARMSRFVIADLTEARSIPQELSTIIPDLPSVPVQPILLATEREYSMFEHFKRYPWVLQDYLYTSIEGLPAALKMSVIDPAEQKAQELAKR
jgi:uncharacterized protein YjbI with pentapeptide repeats